ncbi:DUF4102 domain-containing protein [Chitinimonas arctica]|uniref:DUF4102 domain-containing protein n=1 Tax=Chitinimonas arctica TaxID=2594795 RepID=A0A516S9S9_9NEIS|nr:Arm DNA-binding domain-containing protein [Chitinimonas arctica]QDQ24905.1 DUF4102 domain-containing protein [Chitinimonas arctica]
MPLTDLQIRAAKPSLASKKLADGKGLFLQLNPNGSKYWRLQYRIAGREKLISLGVYPETGLSEARRKRDDARKLLAAGLDPGQNRCGFDPPRVGNDPFALSPPMSPSGSTPLSKPFHADIDIRRHMAHPLRKSLIKRT